MEQLHAMQTNVYQGVTSSSPTLTIAEETSQMAIDDNSSGRSTECCIASHPATLSTSAVQAMLLEHLLKSYDRALNEEKNYPKVNCKRKN